jgi:hypothetical protein
VDFEIPLQGRKKMLPTINFDFDSIDGFFLISVNYFFNSTIHEIFFYPINKKKILLQYLAIQYFLVCFDTVGKHI